MTELMPPFSNTSGWQNNARGPDGGIDGQWGAHSQYVGITPTTTLYTATSLGWNSTLRYINGNNTTLWSKTPTQMQSTSVWTNFLYIDLTSMVIWVIVKIGTTAYLKSINILNGGWSAIGTFVLPSATVGDGRFDGFVERASETAGDFIWHVDGYKITINSGNASMSTEFMSINGVVADGTVALGFLEPGGKYLIGEVSSVDAGCTVKIYREFGIECYDAVLLPWSWANNTSTSMVTRFIGIKDSYVRATHGAPNASNSTYGQVTFDMVDFNRYIYDVLGLN